MISYKQMFIEAVESMKEGKAHLEKLIEDENELLDFLKTSDKEVIKKLHDTLSEEVKNYKKQVKPLEEKIISAEKLIELLENEIVNEAISLLVETFGLFGAKPENTNE